MTAASVNMEDLLREFPKLQSEDIGEFKGKPHRIQNQPDARPFAAKLRPIPIALQGPVEEEIKSMDKMGIWTAVDSAEWVHPMVVVPKKTGGVRITTDLKKLNAFVIPERFPLPRIKDIFLRIRGSTTFSKLDLRKGYFHIPLHKDSQHLATTITPLGLRQYRRLPMGLKDSASAFQRRVHETLTGLEGVEVYIDDILIHGRDKEEHDRRLRNCLIRLDKEDFSLQMTKVIVGEPEVPALASSSLKTE